MGKARILLDSDFSGFGLGVVTRLTKSILPVVTRITEATVFQLVEDGIRLTPSWSISDSTIASLVANSDGTCTVTPLVNGNTAPVILTASFNGDVITLGFIPTLAQTYEIWYIDRASETKPNGTLNNANLVNGGWAFMPVDNKLLQGRTINRVKFVPSAAGVLNFYKASALTGPVTLVGSVNIQSIEIGVLTTYPLDDFTLGSNEIFVIGQANSQGGFKFWNSSENVNNSFYSKVPSSPTPTKVPTPGTAQSDLNFSVGYYGAI